MLDRRIAAPAFDRSDQINQNSRAAAVPREGCSLKRNNRASLYDVERSGRGAQGHNTTKLCSLSSRRIFGLSGSLITGPLRIFSKEEWWSQTGSNRRHPACKAGALPAELWPHQGCRQSEELVGPGRLELPTSRLSGVRSNHLSYGPSWNTPEALAARSG